MRVRQSQILWILALIATTALLGVGAVVAIQWKDQHDFLKQSEVYQDETKGFSFRYPSTWDVMSAEDLAGRNEKFVAGVYIVSEPSTAIGVMVKDRTTIEPLNESVLDLIEKNFSETYVHFQKIESKQIQHDEYLELDIEYTYKRSEKVNVHQRQRIFITPDKIFYISGSVLVIDYPHRQEDFKHILESFILL